MTFFEDDEAITWSLLQKYLSYIRKVGIDQFIQLFKKYKNYKCNRFRFGDEIEYIIVYAPKHNKDECKVSLRSCKIIQGANKNVNDGIKNNINKNDIGMFAMEYTHFQIESIPYKPYKCDSISDLLLIERNMFCRRRWIESTLKRDEKLISMALFPTLGLNQKSTFPSFPTGGNVTKSEQISDYAINCHPKFTAATIGYRHRRGNKKVNIKYGVDDGTYNMLDATVFGNGNALQVTIGCCDMNECKYLYDQLNVISYIMLSISAATPFIAGKISKQDTRWNISVQGQDCRNDKEKNEYLYSTRYGLNQIYLHSNGKQYNDIDFYFDKKCYQQLINNVNDIDDNFAKHISRLFVRDTLFVYKSMIDKIKETDPNRFKNSEEYFQVFQSMNWNNVRFKPPPANNNGNNDDDDNDNEIGWRVEFRTMETQFTDFENAALVIFVTLLSKAILFYNIDLYIPMSKLHENFKLSQNKNALLNEKFWYRMSFNKGNDKYLLAKYSLNHIINGKYGLLYFVNKYIDQVLFVNHDDDNKNNIAIIKEYLSLIEYRCNGKLMNNASYLRHFVNNNKFYKNDCNINEKICRNIIDKIDMISHGNDPEGLVLPKNINMKKRYYNMNIKYLNDYLERNKDKLCNSDNCHQFDMTLSSKL